MTEKLLAYRIWGNGEGLVQHLIPRDEAAPFDKDLQDRLLEGVAGMPGVELISVGEELINTVGYDKPLPANVINVNIHSRRAEWNAESKLAQEVGSLIESIVALPEKPVSSK